MKILEGNGTGDPPKLKRNQKLRLHSYGGTGHLDVTYKKRFEHSFDRPYYIYVTKANGSVIMVDIRDCEIVETIDPTACTCARLTETWTPEDRAALCGHVKDCPRFHENFGK